MAVGETVNLAWLEVFREVAAFLPCLDEAASALARSDVTAGVRAAAPPG